MGREGRQPPAGALTSRTRSPHQVLANQILKWRPRGKCGESLSPVYRPPLDCDHPHMCFCYPWPFYLPFALKGLLSFSRCCPIQNPFQPMPLVWPCVIHVTWVSVLLPLLPQTTVWVSGRSHKKSYYSVLLMICNGKLKTYWKSGSASDLCPLC